MVWLTTLCSCIVARLTTRLVLSHKGLNWFLIDDSIFYSVAVSLTCSLLSFSKWCGRRFVGGGDAKSWITEISEMPDICLSDLQYLPSLATKSRHRLNGMRWLGLADEWTELLQTQEVGPICELSWPMSSFALISLCTDSFFSPSC